MAAMIDATCPKCGRHIGWCGTLANRPACGGCGHRPPQTELDEAEAKMQETMRLLELSPHKASGEELRKQRLLAGLNLHQAAKMIGVPGVTAATVSGWEMGRVPMPPELSEAVQNAYGIMPPESH